MHVKCRARVMNTPDPIDCDWPFCGCDEHARRVVESLQECGWEDGAELRRELRERDALIWAMVRSAGGKLFVSNGDLARGVPEEWRIEENVANNGRTLIVGNR